MFKRISDGPVTVQSKYGEITGTVELGTYSNHTDALLIGDEPVSINLIAYGLVPPAGQCYIKDYSEHEGLADALEAAGVVTKISPVEFGYAGGWLVSINNYPSEED